MWEVETLILKCVYGSRVTQNSKRIQCGRKIEWESAQQLEQADSHYCTFLKGCTPIIHGMPHFHQGKCKRNKGIH